MKSTNLYQDRSRQTLQVMLLSVSPKATAALTPVLHTCGLSITCEADSTIKARKLMAEITPDIVIINTPLADDFGTQLAIELAQKNLGVLVLVKNHLLDQVTYKLEPYGALALGKPLSSADLLQALRLLRPLRLKLWDLESQRASLEVKMKELRLVSRAKLLLIERLHMTEEEANRYIEKSAMDTCTKKSAVADRIIKMYEP